MWCEFDDFKGKRTISWLNPFSSRRTHSASVIVLAYCHSSGRSGRCEGGSLKVVGSRCFTTSQVERGAIRSEKALALTFKVSVLSTPLLSTVTIVTRFEIQFIMWTIEVTAAVLSMRLR